MTDTIRRSGEERQASIQHTAAALGIDEALVSQLVDTFYARVRQDDLLGPIFQAALGEDWDPHLAKLKDFWSAIALGTRRYNGRPMPAHLRLSDRISEAHFVRWLGLFRETVDELMPNPAAADFFYDRANMIGRNFQAMIFALNS
ncbi:group III truncated hemoglobin [Hyphomonas sp.]|uniref:group III truncated hemoglobin n=1 Tax=Hyphomonas sp. TaxID=87 RepID=UPI003242EDAB